jgi:protein O-mannosyl-transferase
MNSGGLKSFVESRRIGLVCLLLATVTIAVYWQVARFEFLNFDEFTMILQNPFVLGGLTRQGVWWGLTTSWFEYWHPVTWWSHMLDCELFGLTTGWHHLVSLGFHVANTLLVFVVLERMTGYWKRSALVAALFALHPLHVESVAWIAERKDVLSGSFFLLALWAYVRHAEVRSPKSEVRSQPAEGSGPWSHSHLPSSIFYLLALLFFALGLMSKPMVVTLPFVLLLLDYWPLRRLQSENQESKIENLLPLLWEKLPFLALTVASCAITYLSAKAGGNILSAEKVPWGLRLANVPVSYVRYLGKMIWPTDLVALYPMPTHWAWWQVGGAVAVLVLISLWVALRARSAPYWIVGWLLFLGMLLPTIGLVQVGFQSIADRYTYIPSIGLFIALVWCAADQVAPRHWPCAVLTWAAAVALLLCGYLTWRQAGYWRNSFTLWTHCLAVNPDDLLAHYNLGYVLQHANRTSEALEQYRAVLRLKPDHLDGNLNLGITLIASNQAQEATNYLDRAVQIKPDYAKAQGALGLALLELGDYAGAVAHCAEAIRLDPADFGPCVNMGRALSAQGKSDDALIQYAEGLRLNPAVPQTHYYLGLEWMKRGEFEPAAASFGEALRLAPGFAEARAQQERALSQRPGGEAR